MAAHRKHKEREAARKDIATLFSLAASAEDPALAQRYVTLARAGASRHRISLRAYNRVHCRACCAYWGSSTLRVRMRPSTVVYTCLSCGKVKRFRKDASRPAKAAARS